MIRKPSTKKLEDNQAMFIELYNVGKDDNDLAKLFKVGERTVSKFANRLRKLGKLKYRKELPVSQTVSTPEIVKAEKYSPIDWKIAKAKKHSKITSKAFSAYLVVADTHVPFVNVPAIKSIFKLMDDVTFDGFIYLGDCMDMTPISHWLQDKRQNRSLENKRMKDDYVEGNKLLDEFDKRLPEGCDKRFFYGNHERFYDDLIEKFPALEGMFEPKEELHLEERKYKVYPVNHVERIGRLHFLHGMYHSQNYVKAHIEKLKVNVMHADLHSPRFRCSESPVREIAMVGYCVGCLCDLAPDFMKGRPNRWSHGFSIVYFYNNGYFDVDLKRIVKGKFIFNNKMYSGND